MIVKRIVCASEAIRSIRPSSQILVGGFGVCGIPATILKELARFQEIQNLTIVSNTAGTHDYGIGLLLENGQVRRIITSYVGDNRNFSKHYLDGRMVLELVPQGTLAERIRSGGNGIPAFYTHTGVDTLVQQGEVDFNNGSTPSFGPVKETAKFQGKVFIREEAIRGDVALIRADKADKFGNLRFRYAARNFNPIMAQAADYTIAEVDEIVEYIHPDDVHLPGVYVNSLVLSEPGSKRIEKVVTRKHLHELTSPVKERIARRVAREFQDGMYVNLGIGIPTLAAQFASNVNYMLQSENGLLGMGPYPADEKDVDPDIIDAGKESVTMGLGASCFASDLSFGMIRSGRLDLTVLGALEVSERGDLANWIVPGKLITGMGGAMDLVASKKTRVIVAMTHVTGQGEPKIVSTCTLPLTGTACVDTIITDLAVFKVRSNGPLQLLQLSETTSIEEVRQKTACPFEVSGPLMEPF